jgi:putative membrane protein
MESAMYEHDGFWMWGPGPIFLILFGILLLLGIAVLVRLLAFYSGQPREGGGRKRALEVLEERYAKGEIDRDEYLQKREDLEG